MLCLALSWVSPLWAGTAEVRAGKLQGLNSVSAGVLEEEVNVCAAICLGIARYSTSSLCPAVMDVLVWVKLCPSEVCILVSIPALIKNCMPSLTSVPCITK